MKKEEFLEMVTKEVNHLRANATDEEKGRLDFSNLRVASRSACIYGQMTGLCNSKRAKQLMPKLYDYIGWGVCSFECQYYSEGTSYTALEKYLFMVGPEVHKEIIDYIKGDIDLLSLKLD